MSPRPPPLETVRAEDFVEYFLFPDCTKLNTDNNTSIELDGIIERIRAISNEFCTGYIWHKDPFRITARYGNTNLLIDDTATAQLDNTDVLPAHIYGLTHFDDNIQDEWFIVALLFQLTREIDGLIVRVIDSDGEFMLIEAAEHIPAWANPETCEQRMYILNGCLHLIDLSVRATAAPEPLSIAEAIRELRLNPTVHCLSTNVQSCIDERIRNCNPQNMAEGLHRTNAYLPVPAAAILQQRPELIAAAVRAFVHRDPIDMKALHAMKHFPPENRVRHPVVFTKYLYAMLTHSQYVPDRRTGWNLQSSSETYKSDLLGVKLACGFEMLAAQAKPKLTNTVDGDLSSNRNWIAYLQSLRDRGYFQDFIEGSRDHQRLMATAKEYFVNHVEQQSSVAADVGTELLSLLKTVEYSPPSSSDVDGPEDDDKWLNVSPEDLDAMLSARYGIRRTISANGNVDAVELTGNLTEFLSRKSEWEGIDLVEEEITVQKKPLPILQPLAAPSAASSKRSKGKVQFAEETTATATTKTSNSDSSTPAASSASNNMIDFNADAFTAHVKEMLDLCIPEDDWESNSDMSDFGGGDDDELDKNINEMGGGGRGKVKSIEAYMAEMDAELSKTTLGKSFEKKSATVAAAEDTDDSFGDIENFKPVDIDVNTLKNMAQSYQNQFGGPGPASSLLGSMGIRVRADDVADDATIYNTQV